MARYTFIATAVALSASLALAVTFGPAMTPVSEAGVSRVAAERITASHAVVDDYLKMTAEARQAADHAADAELAASRRQATAHAELRTAAVSKPAKPVRIAAAVPLPVPSPHPAPSVAPPPLALQAPPLVAQAEPRRQPVLSRVAGTVRGIPRWVGSKVVDAASWVIDLPSDVVARLPERRFL